MTATTVTAKTEESAPVEFPYEFGDNISEAVSIFGEDVVWAHALRGLTVAVQGHARSMIKSGKAEDEIKAEMKKWKPGAPRVTKSAEDRAREQLEALPPEVRAKLLKEMKPAKAA